MSDEGVESVESKRINEIMTLKRAVIDVKDEIDRAEMLGAHLAKRPSYINAKCVTTSSASNRS